MAIWNKIGIAVALLVLCSVAGFLWLRMPGHTPPQALPAPAEPAQLQLVLQGRSYCSVTIPAVAGMSGEVEEIHASIGQQVKKDDLLFKLKLTPADAAALANRLNKGASLRNMELNIEQLNVKRSQLERSIVEVQKLDSLGMAPKNTLPDLLDQQRLLNEQIALAHVQLADAKRTVADDVALLAKNLGQPLQIGSKPQYVFVRAPQDGHILSIEAPVHLGAIVSGTMSIIGSMDPMLIRGQVHESELARLQDAQNATIALDGGKGESFNATLSRVSWAALESSLAAPAYYLFELVVPNPDNKIKDGFKVQVTLQPPPSKDK